MKARIVDIKRFAVHDGDGIRTTIFFKGCPLRCRWCHNPEGLSMNPEIGYYKEKCVNCGFCVGKCSANIMQGAVHRFNRKDCTLCGRCTDICPSECFRFYGRSVGIQELFDEIIADKDFYDSTGGGVTLSGGECFAQAEFSIEFLKKCHENNINTAVDTCGYTSRDNLINAAKYTDMFLYDIKAIDDDVHIRCTQKSNKIILHNLECLSRQNVKIEIRYPCVEGYNTNQAEKIAEFVSGLDNITGVRLLPYHSFSNAKYEAIDAENPMETTKVPSKETMEHITEIFCKKGIRVCGRI